MKKATKKLTGEARTAQKNVSAKSPIPYKDATQKELAYKMEQDLSLLLNHSDESFLLLAPDFRIVTFNKKFHTGYAEYFHRDIKIGDNYLDYLDQERKTAAIQHFQKIFAGESIEMEYELKIEGSESRIMSNRYKPAYNDKGALIGAVVTSTDITEMKRSRQQLTANEQRFRALVENSTDGVAIITPEGKMLYMSPSVQHILGYTEEEAMKLEVFMVVHPDDVAPVQRYLQDSINNPGVPVRAPIARAQHKNGTWRWIESTVTNMLHVPSIGGLVSNFRDITERIEAEKEKKEAEENIRIAKERYDLVARATNEAIWDWDIWLLGSLLY